MAIAAVAMSLLAQLVRIGNRSAAVCRDQAKAQLIAKAVMAEAVSGVTFDLAGGQLPQPLSGPWEQDPDWSYRIDVVDQAAANSEASMSVITVSVSRSLDLESPTATAEYSLTQWLFIPPPPEEETTEETDDTAAATDGGA